MCNNPDLLTDRTPHQTSILGAVSAKTVKSTEIGTAHLICRIGDRTQAIDLKNVLLIPSLQKNLISISRICAEGGQVSFDNNVAVVTFNNKVVMRDALISNNLYRLIQVIPAGANLTSI